MHSALAEAEAEPEELLFSTAQVARLTGASYRQLDTWWRSGYITDRPVISGTGWPRKWTAAHIERATVFYAASRAFLPRGFVDLPKLADFVKRAAEAGVFP
jgi:hypothetical protein